MSTYEEYTKRIEELLEIKEERKWEIEEQVEFNTLSYKAMRVKQEMESKDQ